MDTSSSSRTRMVVLESHASFDFTSRLQSIGSIRCVSISSEDSNSQTLIYVGTQSGTLTLLSISNVIVVSQPEIDLIRTIDISSSSSVESINVLHDLGRVLLVSGGLLYMATDLLLLGPLKKLSFLKGISLIARRWRRPGSDCTNLSPPDSAGKSQRFFTKFGGGIRPNAAKSNGSDQQHVLDSQCSDTTSSSNNLYVFAVVIGKRLVLIEFVLGTSSNDRIGRNDREIDSPGCSFLVLKEIQCVDLVQTMVWIDDSIIVGTPTGYSLISCVTGQMALIFSLPDPTTTPRLKLLRRNCKVLLMVDNVGIIVNGDGQPVGGSLVFRRTPDSVGEISSSSLIVVNDGKMELYHKKSGTCIQVVPMAGEGVGRCLVADDDYGRGAIVAVATPFKIICYKRVPYEEQIKDLLRKKNFKEAISLVEELESDGEMTKEMLSFVYAQVGFLLLFDLHFKEAVDYFLQSEAMQPSELFPFIMRDPNRWSLLVPRNRYWGLHPPPAPLEDVVDDGLLAIQRAIFLRKAGVETAVDENFMLNPPSRAELLNSAIRNITRYLEASRGKELALSVREGVDTLLMYLYRALNRVADMEKLASSENSCIVEELENLLDDSGHLRTLAFLYASKGMPAKALAIWRLLARNYSSGLWKDPDQTNIFQDAGTSNITGKEISAIEASKILEDSSDQDLVLQQLGWIADVDQLLAVQVLTSDKRVKMLSPDEVIAAIDQKKVEIFQRYLQWLIEDQDSSDTRFHTFYALSLSKSAIEILETETTYQNDKSGLLERGDFSDVRIKSIFDSPVRERLQIFLESSDLYDPEEVLYLIEGTELWLEKAVLYRKLGQETLVLQILALKLENSEAAEQYCAEIGRPDAYMQLLDMYLDPQDGKQPMFKAAVRLLHKYGVSLDPLQVLEKLSPDMPLQLASETILRMLRARLHHHLQGQIVHNICRAVDTDARLARLEERSRHVQINDESLCDSCHTRLGTKLFAMYPDDTVVCYKCFRRQGESTSVTGRNFKQDVLIKPGWLVTG